MPFFKFENRLRLIKVILIQNVIASTSCDHCLFYKKVCTVMNSHPKCAKCIRRDRFCVSISLKSFNRVHEELKHQLNQVEVEHKTQLVVLFCLVVRMFRLKKMLKKNKIRTARKVRCVVFELDDNNDSVNDEFFIEMSLSQFVNNLFANF